MIEPGLTIEITPQLIAPTLIFLPLGVVAGRWLVHHVTPLVFDRIILGILTATGIYLLFV